MRPSSKTIIQVSLARPSHETIKGANLYVAGLPRSLTQPELEKIFLPFGNIITSRILSDNVTGKYANLAKNEAISGLSKGVGFVRFDKKNEAEIAIEKLNGSTPSGFTEPMQVKFANSPASTSQKAMLQMAQAATTLLPLTVLQNALTVGAPTRRVSAQTVGGPIHHQPQVGRFRYSPIGNHAGLANTVTAQTNPALSTAIPTADLLTVNTLLQLQQQHLALQQAAVAAQTNPTILAASANAPTGLL